MTIYQALKSANQKLKIRDIPDPRLEAELLLSATMKKPRQYLFAYPEKQLTRLQITNYKLQISRRAKSWPVAYLTGSKEFYGYQFQVNRNVLIPRPESELLVERALKIISRQSLRPPEQNRNLPLTIIDLGTGSGCLIISLLKQLQQHNINLASFNFLASDISPAALRLARRNARNQGVDKIIKFLRGDLLKPILSNRPLSSFIRYSPFDIRHSSFFLLANLPYLTPAQIKQSPTIKYEPKLALAAGPDGLKYYRHLFKQLKLLPAGLPLACLLEFDPDQTKKLKQLVLSELPGTRLTIKKDLAGYNRLAEINFTT